MAIRREVRLPHLTHDLEHHIKMLDLAAEPDSLCAISGRSQFSLRKIGEFLTVDRIDNQKGYVPGNCQLMACSLNRAKHVNDRVPQSAINRLLRRLERVVEDKLSAPPVQT